MRQGVAVARGRRAELFAGHQQIEQEVPVGRENGGCALGQQAEQLGLVACREVPEDAIGLEQAADADAARISGGSRSAAKCVPPAPRNDGTRAGAR